MHLMFALDIQRRVSGRPVASRQCASVAGGSAVGLLEGAQGNVPGPHSPQPVEIPSLQGGRHNPPCLAVGCVQGLLKGAT